MRAIYTKSISRMGGVALSIFLALSLIAAALPQQALAAGATKESCASQHEVKKGDTRTSIADKYKMKWWQIAEANNLPLHTALTVGTKLCIPTDAWLASATPGSMTATAVGKKLTITMADFNVRSIWNVNVRDASGNVVGNFLLGRIISPKKGSITGIYTLPQDLFKTPTLKVCVTAEASMMICQVINHKL